MEIHIFLKLYSGMMLKWFATTEQCFTKEKKKKSWFENLKFLNDYKLLTDESNS